MHQVIEPKVRGFICTTAHPEGCAQNVIQQKKYVCAQAHLTHPPKKVLVIGASTGYGLASRIAAAFGCHAQTIGVFFERPAENKRTASAGWYNTVAFENLATEAGLYAKSINGDAFSDEIKQATFDLIRRDWHGQVDLVVYSLASPRRTDPKTGAVYNSVLKTIEQPFKNKNVDVFNGTITDITIEPATEDEIAQTVAVMGGTDWMLWIEALLAEGLLAEGAVTVAYDYIGPELTFPIYHHGTIGRAKADLRKTAKSLNSKLASLKGHAYISVNKAVVTQASSAIPVVPLYISLLFKVMKAQQTQEGCIEQIWRLFSQRLFNGAVPTDAEGLIRIDDWEMAPEVQAEVKILWDKISSENIYELSDLEGYRDEFYRLFGFKVPGVDYTQASETEQNIASLS